MSISVILKKRNITAEIIVDTRLPLAERRMKAIELKYLAEIMLPIIEDATPQELAELILN